MDKNLCLPSGAIHKNGKDMSGLRFGRLSVLQMAGRRSNRQLRWACVCDCGTSVVVDGNALRSGATTSCGCFAREKARAAGDRTRTHGMSGTSTYFIYQGMIYRCHDPKSKDFARYGGRGIVVCDRWRESFENFLADMGERPPGLSLDRMNNHGNYEPGNCRWATYAEQSRNSRNATPVTINGKTQCITDWCRELGISKGTVSARMFHGWELTRAILTPPDPRRMR